MLESKYTVPKRKNSFDSHISRLDMTEKRIIKLKDM